MLPCSSWDKTRNIFWCRLLKSRESMRLGMTQTSWVSVPLLKIDFRKVDLFSFESFRGNRLPFERESGLWTVSDCLLPVVERNEVLGTPGAYPKCRHVLCQPLSFTSLPRQAQNRGLDQRSIDGLERRDLSKREILKNAGDRSVPGKDILIELLCNLIRERTIFFHLAASSLQSCFRNPFRSVSLLAMYRFHPSSMFRRLWIRKRIFSNQILVATYGPVMAETGASFSRKQRASSGQ